MYPSNKKKKVWREEKERLLKMTLEERRKEYVRDYVSLSTILSWKEEMKSKGQNDGCIPNGWRNGGECHGKEDLRILPETVMERKSYSLGNRKRGPLSDLVFQSILNQERLTEDSLRRVL